jgi:D-alanine---(R)-lactate ligase
MHRTRVAILFGGCSEEHEISVRSATEIAAHIDTATYEPIYVGITRSGAWHICERPRPGWEDTADRPAVLSPDRTVHGLLALGEGGWQVVPVDVVFPVLHGRWGEDGAVQGLLELAGIPYVGCGVASSAICMDKSLTYTVARSAGIATPEFVVLDPADPCPAVAPDLPAFVKPARSGSSFGVTRVERDDDLEPAIATARRFDTKVVVERAVVGAEVGCAVMGRGSDLVVGEVDEVELSHGIFRIHQEADPENGSENAFVRVPAGIPGEQRRAVQSTAKVIYSALGCEGLARVDMFLLPDGRLVLNEVNTLPGFTSYSRYPRMMAGAGIELPELIHRLVSAATTR